MELTVEAVRVVYSLIWKDPDPVHKVEALRELKAAEANENLAELWEFDELSNGLYPHQTRPSVS